MKKFLISLLFLVLFVILAWWSWDWYKKNALCCGDNLPATTDVAVEEISYGPLTFDWENGSATTHESWADKKNELLADLADGKVLRIVGPYFSEEVNTTSFENLGLARADAVQKLLLDSIPAEKMEIDSKLLDPNADAKTKPFEGIDFAWVIRNENVQEIDNKALIYFPYNSTQRIDNANISDYLNKVAQALEGNDKKVYLTGYTDNVGNPEFNRKLGRDRASAVKQTLIDSGVSADRILVDSQGQSDPIASNDTEAGREKNRRVVLEIK
ncbi:MAG: OmpA family protein [Flavobacteriaceae bacterium]|nr:OmpA family protein [Flavobacteriaceae bacterium]